MPNRCVPPFLKCRYEDLTHPFPGLGITAEVTTFGSNQTLTGPLVHTPPSHPDSPFSFAFWIALLVFNAILTTLIVVRLLVVRARIIETMGKQYGKTYTGPMAIFIESAILYDLFVTVGYLCLPTVPRVGNMFTPTIAQVQVSQASSGVADLN